jgi:hydrogenase nickel incorporation protein HypB
MCRECGCGSTTEHSPGHHHHHLSVRRVSVGEDLRAKSDRLAHGIRKRLDLDGIAAFNLIGAPGAGKTTLLEQAIRSLGSSVPVAVLEGDQATNRDAQRIAGAGARVVQINTGAGCHLDCAMITRGLDHLRPEPRSLLFIENVGNLVCPALFDLGERAKIVVMSVTEGEDKPLKYPHVFHAATALVVTKADLLPHLAVKVDECIANARRINPRLVIFVVAALRGDGVDEWCAWLRGHLEA